MGKLEQEIKWMMKEIKPEVKDMNPAQREKLLNLCSEYLYGDATPSQLPPNKGYSP